MATCTANFPSTRKDDNWTLCTECSHLASSHGTEGQECLACAAQETVTALTSASTTALDLEARTYPNTGERVISFGSPETPVHGDIVIPIHDDVDQVAATQTILEAVGPAILKVLSDGTAAGSSILAIPSKTVYYSQEDLNQRYEEGYADGMAQGERLAAVEVEHARESERAAYAVITSRLERRASSAARASWLTQARRAWRRGARPQ